MGARLIVDDAGQREAMTYAFYDHSRASVAVFSNPLWKDWRARHVEDATLDLTRNAWPEYKKHLVGWRYADIVILHFDYPRLPIAYVKRGEISDPYFWEQPFNREWVDDLKRMLGGGV